MCWPSPTLADLYMFIVLDQIFCFSFETSQTQVYTLHKTLQSQTEHTAKNKFYMSECRGAWIWCSWQLAARRIQRAGRQFENRSDWSSTNNRRNNTSSFKPDSLGVTATGKGWGGGRSGVVLQSSGSPLLAKLSGTTLGGLGGGYWGSITLGQHTF